MTRTADDSKQTQETISAAIEKLERMRTERGYFVVNGWLVEPAAVPRPYDHSAPSEPDAQPLTNDELIVTLFNTLDAQLQVMTTALDFFETYGIWVTHEERDSALALAQSILKGEHR